MFFGNRHIFDLNIRAQHHIRESIVFRFPGNSDDAIVITYCILYANHYIYLEKLKDEHKNVDLM